jgi:hypothetical protein
MKIFLVTVNVNFISHNDCSELVVVSDTEADVERQIVDFYSDRVSCIALSAVAGECGPVGKAYFLDDHAVNVFSFEWKR